MSIQARDMAGSSEQIVKETPGRATLVSSENHRYDGETYFPVYCLTNVPNEYFEEFHRYADIVTDVPLIEVTSTKPDRFAALEAMQTLDRRNRRNVPSAVTGGSVTSPSLPSLPYPFRENSIEQVFEDFITRLRPPPESVVIEPFTYNTIAVVDADCVSQRPWKCVLCTDAVAFVEGEPHEDLKQLRMPLGKELCTALGTIESMVVAPNEIWDSEGRPYWPAED